MNQTYDQEFEFPPEKDPYSDLVAEPPTSPLAIVSLIFSILGVTALPLLGSIVGIVTGHASMGQIRESQGRLGGRAMAKAGLILGYVPIVLVLIGVSLAFLILSTTRTISFHENPETATITVETRDQMVRGVKMVNEMNREDHELIEATEVPVDEAKIIAFYNAGKPRSDPEFALLTDQTLVYLKEGHATVFELAEVSEIKGDEAYETYSNSFDPLIYHIEVRKKDGPRMRINIESQPEGAAFFDALESAWKSAKERAESSVTQ